MLLPVFFHALLALTLCLVPADQSPTAMDMGRDDPLYAAIVAEHFDIVIEGRKPAVGDCADPFIRLEVSIKSAQLFEMETRFKPLFQPRRN